MNNNNRSRAQKREHKKRLKKRAKIRKNERARKSVQSKPLSDDTVNYLVDALNFSSDIPEELQVAKSGFKKPNKLNRIDIALFLLLQLMIDQDEYKSIGFYLTNNEIGDDIDWNPHQISLMLGWMKLIGAINVSYEPDVAADVATYKRKLTLTPNSIAFLKDQYENVGTTYDNFYAYWYMVKDVPLDFDYNNQFYN